MKNIFDLSSLLIQTSVRFTKDSDRLQIVVAQNSFLAGHIILSQQTFYNSPRSAKNLFHLFGSPGLGINSEIVNIILPFFDIDKIVIPYEGVEIMTTVSKWKRSGIVSPFADKNRIDKQIILRLNEINLNDVQNRKNESADHIQFDLFGEVENCQTTNDLDEFLSSYSVTKNDRVN